MILSDLFADLVAPERSTTLARFRLRCSPTTVRRGFARAGTRFGVMMVALGLAFSLATAQMPADLTAATPDDAATRADSLHAAGDAAAALGILTPELRERPTFELLWRAAREAVHLGILDHAEGRRDAAARWFVSAQGFAERAVEADSTDARGWAWLAITLGRRSELVGSLERVQIANRILETAQAALERDPNQSGALHVLGTWHAEVTRLSAIERFTARSLLGGSTFDAADRAEAEALLRRATEVAPEEIVHRLEYARILNDLDRRPEAMEQLRAAVGLVRRHPADELYRADARSLLREWGG